MYLQQQDILKSIVYHLLQQMNISANATIGLIDVLAALIYQTVFAVFACKVLHTPLCYHRNSDKLRRRENTPIWTTADRQLVWLSFLII